MGRHRTTYGIDVGRAGLLRVVGTRLVVHRVESTMASEHELLFDPWKLGQGGRAASALRAEVGDPRVDRVYTASSAGREPCGHEHFMVFGVSHRPASLRVGSTQSRIRSRPR